MVGLNRLNIGPRLALMLGVQVVLLLIVGAVGLVALNNSSNIIDSLAVRMNKVVDTVEMTTLIREEFQQPVNKVNIGAMTWEDGRELIEAFESKFDTGYRSWLIELQARGKEQELREAERVRSLFGDALLEIQVLFDKENRGFLEQFLLNDADALIDPMTDLLTKEIGIAQEDTQMALEESRADALLSMKLTAAVLIGGLLMAVLLGIVLTRSLLTPVNDIHRVVTAVATGDLEARTHLELPDEIGMLGRAFDKLLDERVTHLAQTEREAEQLNDSVISLLRAVSTLSDRDLTVQVPVTEDATGPVADAINQLAGETATVLQQVQRISKQVEQASDQVNVQAREVNEVGRQQQLEIEETAAELASASRKLMVITETARKSNKVADVTIRTTKAAAGTVLTSKQGMERIRETIQETGKRIKRLGERTQEISGIVDVINGIAERTTVLALNASMQAASAGEAGRGFAVVADEVQRLAESSRKATDQIATLVKNIVAETNDTMAVMDHAIGNVVDGSRQADQAAQQMAKTLKATNFLVESVEEIASGTEEQAVIAVNLRERANQIREHTQKTAAQLNSQLEKTSDLAEYARKLVDSVAVFTLPE
jgi:methyl-accepting chemotaxis protein